MENFKSRTLEVGWAAKRKAGELNGKVKVRRIGVEVWAAHVERVQGTFSDFLLVGRGTEDTSEEIMGRLEEVSFDHRPARWGQKPKAYDGPWPSEWFE